MTHARVEHSVLVIEDDETIALGLCDAFDFEGFRVTHATSGRDGVYRAKVERPDCVILDVMLPDLNGYQVCEQIRKDDPHVPILMLTARAQEADKVRGLDVGADDYITKPFSLAELLARVRALLRRASRSMPAPVTQTFSVGPATIDPSAQTLHRDGETTVLSFYEVQLLKLLHERAGRPVSRDEILDRVWGVGANPSNRTVDNFVVRLRKKIEPNPEEPRYILTVYGTGYKLVQ
jgi:DNA-binding response OmpR family regulator